MKQNWIKNVHGFYVAFYQYRVHPFVGTGDTVEAAKENLQEHYQRSRDTLLYFWGNKKFCKRHRPGWWYDICWLKKTPTLDLSEMKELIVK